MMAHAKTWVQPPDAQEIQPVILILDGSLVSCSMAWLHIIVFWDHMRPLFCFFHIHCTSTSLHSVCSRCWNRGRFPMIFAGRGAVLRSRLWPALGGRHFSAARTASRYVARGTLVGLVVSWTAEIFTCKHMQTINRKPVSKHFEHLWTIYKLRWGWIFDFHLVPVTGSLGSPGWCRWKQQVAPWSGESSEEHMFVVVIFRCIVEHKNTSIKNTNKN